ncbi:uncharacterized protein M421DRAFT_177774 [Didymella exigua CBS 183.55]|uniref:Uncharacterized protein n=1 Tax=Didymella exigua CBS 183.55 TaxID=1150837 RepID=A0A6A5RJD2_9PLEO|nr:uncharacterized protein M421DRAFT_177774 [Didymella exigua CBS 183.55]KAF1927360.1 hypothetical protein M421DRAFT_177774 [Didymella exigua CBS 183.55]
MNLEFVFTRRYGVQTKPAYSNTSINRPTSLTHFHFIYPFQLPIQPAFLFLGRSPSLLLGRSPSLLLSRIPIRIILPEPQSLLRGLYDRLLTPHHHALPLPPHHTLLNLTHDIKIRLGQIPERNPIKQQSHTSTVLLMITTSLRSLHCSYLPNDIAVIVDIRFEAKVAVDLVLLELGQHLSQGLGCAAGRCRVGYNGFEGEEECLRGKG